MCVKLCVSICNSGCVCVHSCGRCCLCTGWLCDYLEVSLFSCVTPLPVHVSGCKGGSHSDGGRCPQERVCCSHKHAGMVYMNARHADLQVENRGVKDLEDG